MFEQWALQQTPKYHFTGSTPADFAAWKAAALPQVLATIGDYPERVPLNPELEAEWEHDGLRKQRWVIDVQPFMSAGLLINTPLDLPEGEKLPAILCWQGHGPEGKEYVMGNFPHADPAIYDRCYGHRLAKEGFITYSLDWIGSAERRDDNWPHRSAKAGGRDWCNLYYLQATMLGTTVIAINVLHGMAATDFMCGLPQVDGSRLGVMGASGGGTMTMWMALCDPRFSTADIITYSGLWTEFGFRDANYCGMQVSPGLYKLVELGDCQGLIAPKPLLVDIGAYDDCFHISATMACQRQLEKIYQAAGVPENLEMDLTPSGHGWQGVKAISFFKKHLKF